MFGSIGMPELLIIFVIALIIFGPRKLPELGKSLGRSLSEFKRASNDLRNTLEEEIRIEDKPADEDPRPKIATEVEANPPLRLQPKPRPQKAARAARSATAFRPASLTCGTDIVVCAGTGARVTATERPTTRRDDGAGTVPRPLNRGTRRRRLAAG